MTERQLSAFLLEALYAFTGEGWEQEDDITILTVRSSAIGPDASEVKRDLDPQP
jgi:hypothetical protein